DNNIDILLDSDGDDVAENGDFKIGDGRLDDCCAIFKLNSNSLKYDPILAPNLVMMMNSKTSSLEIKQTLALNLGRDNKKYKVLEVKNGNIDFEI
ncbi:MAG: hypothetical protein K8R85_11110, partial [Bacteroidetes bacterium]|nr:hypothetical protein [Bacteroidota bacterium]